jgi:hypothetical protein
VATGRYLGLVLAAHATCHANSIALRGLLGFDAAKAASAPAAPAPLETRDSQVARGERPEAVRP